MPSSQRSSTSEPEYVLMPVRSHAGSENGGQSRSESDGDSPPKVINNTLEVPQPRLVASSTSEPGHDRNRSHDRPHSRSSNLPYSGSSRPRHSRSHERSRRIDEGDLPYEYRKDIEYARQQRRDDEERKILERLKKARDEEKKRWALEEEEEKVRRKKEREAILLEAKLEEERKKLEMDELRKKILLDEEERVKKEKEKRKAEEEEFERKVKEKFMKAGYSPEYIEEVLHKRKEEQATQSIDLDREAKLEEKGKQREELPRSRKNRSDKAAQNPIIPPTKQKDFLAEATQSMSAENFHEFLDVDRGFAGPTNGFYWKVNSLERRAMLKYHIINWLINVLLIAQVALSTVIVALGATKHQYQKPITILGAFNGVITGILAIIKGQGLPGRFYHHASGLRKVAREIGRLERIIASGGNVTRGDCERLYDMYDGVQKEYDANFPDIWKVNISSGEPGYLGVDDHLGERHDGTRAVEEDNEPETEWQNEEENKD